MVLSVSVNHRPLSPGTLPVPGPRITVWSWDPELPTESSSRDLATSVDRVNVGSLLRTDVGV